VQFLDPKNSGTTNADPTAKLEPEANDNKNLDTIDIVDDDLPF
jgi:hypothetical protein